MPEAKASFDEAVVAKLKECFGTIYLAHPEVANLAAVICWRGELNDARIVPAVWNCPEGAVHSMEGIVGGIGQTLKLLETQVGYGWILYKKLRESTIELAKEEVRLLEVIKNLEDRCNEQRKKNYQDAYEEGRAAHP